jgi:hypothetical protein
MLRIRDVLSRIPDPDPTIAPSRIRIPDPTYFCIKAINNFFCLSRIPDPDPSIAPSRIRGVKKHRIPDPQHCISVTFLYAKSTGTTQNFV